MFRALSHHDFRLYATGMAISLTGSWMQGMAQSWLMYRLSHSEFMLGATMFCTHGPVLLLASAGGLAADRYRRRTIVLITQTASLVQALVLAALTYTGQISTGLLLAMAVTLGVINAFDLPARQTMFSKMVPRQDLISAISLNSAVFNSARVVGPSLAGLTVAAVGESICFLLNSLSFVAMIVCLLKMKHVDEERDVGGAHVLEQLRAGFLYAHRSRHLKTVLAMTGLLNLAYGPVLALAPFFADAIFHHGSEGLGFLTGAIGMGAVFGVLELARQHGIAGMPRVVWWSSLLMGGALALFSISPAYAICLALAPVIGYSLMRQNTAGNSLIQSVVPDSFRGRVMALFSMVVTGFLPFGSLSAGLLAERYGARPVVAVAGVACLAGAAIYRLALPGIEAWVAQQELE
jgi:MFS family permease